MAFVLFVIFIANFTLSYNLIASDIPNEISEQKRSVTIKEKQQDKKARKSLKTKDKNLEIETLLGQLNNLKPVNVTKKERTNLQSSYPDEISYSNLCRIFLAPLVAGNKDKVKSPNFNNGPKIVKMSEEFRPDKVEINVEISGEKVLVKCSHKVINLETRDKFQEILGLVRNEKTHQLKSLESIEDSAQGPEMGVEIVALKQNVILPNRAIHTLGTENNAKSSLVEYRIYKNHILFQELPPFTMAFARKLI